VISRTFSNLPNSSRALYDVDFHLEPLHDALLYSRFIPDTVTHTTMSDFPVIENPAKLKVVELKEELDKRGLPLGGLKKDVRLFQ